MDEDERTFQRVVKEGLVPKVDSAAVCVIPNVPDVDGSTKAADLDVQFAVQLGVMIMLDKPILVVKEPGQEVSKKLLGVADLVVEADLTSDEGQAKIRAATEQMMADFG